MMQRLVRPFSQFKGLLRGAAIAALGLAALAVPGTAEAGIRLTLSAPLSATQVFAVAGDSLLQSATIDGYTVTLNTILTNFSTDPNAGGGSLSTTVTYNTGAGPIADLTVLAEVINGGLVGSPLAIFTSPTNTGSILTADVTAAGTSGQVTGTSFANAASTVVGPVNIPGLVETFNTTTVNAAAGYTLRNTLLVQGVAPSSSAQSVTIRSSVTAVPEPATVAMALSALPLIGLGVLRRRRAA